MKSVNLTPVGFSAKGLKSLIKQLKKTNDFKALVKSGDFVEGKLCQRSVDAYFEEATKDDKGTVYFCEKEQAFKIWADFETGTWSNNLQTVKFEFSDFEYDAFEVE